LDKEESRLRLVIIVHYCQRQEAGLGLAEEGILQANKIAVKIKEIIGRSKSVKIFCPYRDVAKQAADIIGKKIGVGYQALSILVGLEQIGNVIDLIKRFKNSTKALILITDQAQCNCLLHNYKIATPNARNQDLPFLKEGGIAVIKLLFGKPKEIMEFNANGPLVDQGQSI
jgi:phosphohistidine phosphatase SixA